MNQQVSVTTLVVFLIVGAGFLVSFGDDLDSIRGIAVAELTSSEKEVRTRAFRQLRSRLGVSTNPRQKIALPEEEIETLVQVAENLIEHLEHDQRDPELRKPFARVMTCAGFTRDILSRCENRKTIAFSLQHALLFSNAWSTVDGTFAKGPPDRDLESHVVRGHPVGLNHVARALILSEAATPELLIDLIASGDARVPMEYHRRGNWKKYFVDIAAYVIAMKLEMRRSEGSHIITRADQLPIADTDLAAEMAREVQQLTAQIQNPDSGVLRCLKEETDASFGES